MNRMCQAITMMLLSIAIFAGPQATLAATGVIANQQVQIVASEMCCKGCARKVSGQLYAARGVKSVSVDMKTRVVTVSLPQPSFATLGQLWYAVEQGEGGPAKLVTPEATYTLVRPESTEPMGSGTSIVVENLHCKGCAQKIAGQLYALRGVTKVSVAMAEETLIIETRADAQLSPWTAIEAVAKAEERPRAVRGSYGTLKIDWATPAAPKTHKQAQLTTNGGIQR